MNTFFFDDVQYPEGLFGGKDFFNPIIYSTEEREVGVWIDNKPLYQKTFIITSKQSQIDISSLNIDTYVKSESVYRIGSYCFEMPRLSDITQNYNAYISTYFAELNSGIIYFLWGTNVSSVDELHFTIQYTKTTDVAGSAHYTTLGVPAVHYTTDEQVIGTWFGETLYQKSYIIPSPITIRSNGTIINDYIDNKNLIKNIIDSYCNGDTYKSSVDISTYEYNGDLYALANSNYGDIKYITLKYTKTS